LKDAEAVRAKYVSVQAALADELAKAIDSGKITFAVCPRSEYWRTRMER
jgi:hypothetical protein